MDIFTELNSPNPMSGHIKKLALNIGLWWWQEELPICALVPMALHSKNIAFLQFWDKFLFKNGMSKSFAIDCS